MLKSIYHKLRNSPYGHFLIKSILFLTVVFAIDFSLGSVLRYFYFKQESGEQYRATYSIEKTTADILVFGSSRANHHYHPDVFEKRIEASYYNVGRDANFIFYHYAVLKSILKRHTPKIIVLDIISGEFALNQVSYDRISSLLPYEKNHPELRDIIVMKSDFEDIKLLSSIYPFNSSLFTIAVGNMEFNKRRKPDIKGYVPLVKKWDRPIEITDGEGSYEIDDRKLKIYESFIKDCRSSNVQLFIVCSPYYIKFNHIDPSITLAHEMAKKYNVDFFDYSQNSVFMNNPSLFSDFSHLNDEGARIFSNLLIDGIQR